MKVSTGAFVIVALTADLYLHSTPQKQPLDLSDVMSPREVYLFRPDTASALKMAERSPTWPNAFPSFPLAVLHD